MTKLIIFLFVTVISMNAYAWNNQDASRIVAKYSETIACQLGSDGGENQYKAITIIPGMADLSGFGAVWVVYWKGDVGCAGGAYTISPNFTVVEHSGFGSAKPVVKVDYEFPDIDIVKVTSIFGKNGLLIINGVTRGLNDQKLPTKVVSYTFKLVDKKFVKQ